MFKFYRKQLFGLWWVVCAVATMATQTNASHSVGADLTYQCLGNNTYKFTLAFYYDCGGILPPPGFPNANGVVADLPSILISSSSCGRNEVIELNYETSNDISPICLAEQDSTSCNGGSLPGVQQYIYSGVFTLPAECPDWRISYNHCCRNELISNSVNPGGFNLHVETWLNNTAAVGCNNSPTFTTPPVPFICAGQSFTYNHGAIDADGDSLVYAMVSPLSNSSVNVPYQAGFSPTYPISTFPANSSTFNTFTGQYTLTPSMAQVSIVAILVQEYRNGVLIGSTTRDMQVIVLNCNNNSPTVSAPFNVSGGTYNVTTETFTVCTGNTLEFDITATDLDANTILQITNNLQTAIPDAIITVSGTNPALIHFEWQTNFTSGGTYNFTLNVSDDACPFPGFQVVGYNIAVPYLELTTSGFTVCPGVSQTIQLGATVQGSTDGTYAWTPSAGLSNPNIPNPTATISQPTEYVLTYNNGICVVRDTAIISPLASLQVTASNDTLCDGAAPIQLNANYQSASGNPIAYTWLPNTVSNPFIANPTVNPTQTTTYTVTATDGICPQTQTVTIVRASCVCEATANINPSFLEINCINQFPVLDASNSTGNSFEWTTTDGNIQGATNGATVLANIAGTYIVTVSSNLFGGCSSTAAVTITENITPPAATTAVSNSITCVNANATITAGTGNNYTWSANAGNVGNAATISVSPTQNTTYTVTVTGANGCTNTSTAQVTVNTTPPVATAASANTIDCINNSTELCATGGQTYNWNHIAGTDNPACTTVSPTASTTYTVTVTAANGCTASTTVQAIRNDTPPTIQAATSNNIDCINTTATLTATGGLIYAWEPANTNENPIQVSPTQNTTYTVTATAANGCTNTATVQVTVNTTTPQVTASASNTITCTNVAAILTATGGTSYAWQPNNLSGNDIIVSPTQNTTYTVTATAANGCTNTATIQVAVNTTTPNVTASANNTITCTTPSAEICANGGDIYNWNHIAGANNPACATVSPTANTTYTVTATAANGCTNTATVSVLVNNTPPAITTTTSNEINCNQPNAEICAVGNGTISWNIGDDDCILVANNVTSTYTATITGANGCTNTAVATVVVNTEPPTVAAQALNNLDCVNQTATLTANGGIAYVWSNGATGSLISVLSTGIYTVTVTGANGCTNTTTTEVTANTAVPTVLTTSTNAGCDEQSGTATAQVFNGLAPFTYVWSNTSASTTQTITNLSVGIYTVTVTGANGCTRTAAVAIDGVAIPILNTQTTNPVCNNTNGNIDLSVSNGIAPYTYLWSNSATTQDLTNIAAGIYTVTVTAANGCTRTITANVILDNALPTVFTTTSNIVTCNQTTAQICAVGDGTFLWNTNDNTACINITPTQSATYTVTITGANGCTNTATAGVVVNTTSPTATAQTLNNISCITPNANLTANGGGAYTWSNGETASFISVSTAGIYTVTVTGANGCTNTATTEVTANIATPTVLTSSTNAGCDEQSGTATAQVFNGLAPFTYVWSNTPAGTTQTITNLSVGIYTVTVTGANGCTRTAAVAIDGIAIPVLTTQITNTTCNNADGSIDLTVSNGIAPYSYVWSNGSTDQDLNGNLSGGTYTVTVTANNGCTRTATATVQTATSPILASFPIQTTCNNNDGGIIIAVGGNDTPYTYSWSNATTTQNLLGVAGGVYSVTVTGNSGCTAILTDTVVATLSPTLAADLIQSATCGQANGSATIAVNGGVAPYTYIWSNGTTETAIANVAGGTYTVTVFESNGCFATTELVIGGGNSLSAIVTPDTTLCGGGQTVLLTAQGIGGDTGNYSYLWSTTETNDSITVQPTQSATYYVTVTDGGLCAYVDSVRVNINQPPTLTIVGDTVVLKGRPFQFNVSGAIGYEWTPATGLDNPNSANPTGMLQDTGTYVYTVQGVDDKGCIATGQISIRVVDIFLDCLEQHEGVTPNGDGINDTWNVPCLAPYENEMQIYNRWGQLMYSKTNYLNEWDATYNNKPVPDGTYYYILQIKTAVPSQAPLYKGTITVIR